MNLAFSFVTQRASEHTDLFKGKTGGLRNLFDEISSWMR